MLRKALQSNKFCLIVTGILWLITIFVRFVLAYDDGTVPGAGWVLWIVCNNLIVAGFAWQLGAISGSSRAEKKIRRLRRVRDEIKSRAEDDC